MQQQPSPHPVPGPPPRPADPRAGIDEAMAGLDDLDRVPLAEHVERFDAVHTQLTFALSSIDKV
ncbi:hypothetical protein [Amycolatopsis alkalitolerans]|uniref:Uncharacterized protein n=1 Tax=Amycolatopsis alkalitolerans TaxID=2547244 RepID=A0A5C4M1K8_9PSEU|nr:hypothetical protein [Amycolatopsis alkalitolerans]TNC26581.1 hypothetical protein FG385_12605 [Amycolatopsis alkalitolerans]